MWPHDSLAKLHSRILCDQVLVDSLSYPVNALFLVQSLFIFLADWIKRRKIILQQNSSSKSLCIPPITRLKNYSNFAHKKAFLCNVAEAVKDYRVNSLLKKTAFHTYKAYWPRAPLIFLLSGQWIVSNLPPFYVILPVGRRGPPSWQVLPSCLSQWIME